MLKIYIVSLLTIGCLVRGGVIQTIGEEEEDHFENFLKKRCTQNADMFDMEQHAHKLKVRKLCLAAETTFLEATDDENEIKERCEEWTGGVDKCFAAILELIEPCFKSDERYLPEFARESYKAYLQDFCAHPKYFTITELLDKNMAKCFNRFMKHPDTDPQKVCFASMKLFDGSYKSLITRRQMCHDLNNVYSCYERHYKEHCADSPDAWKFQSGLINALRSPCTQKHYFRE